MRIKIKPAKLEATVLVSSIRSPLRSPHISRIAKSMLNISLI